MQDLFTLTAVSKLRNNHSKMYSNPQSTNLRGLPSCSRSAGGLKPPLQLSVRWSGLWVTVLHHDPDRSLQLQVCFTTGLMMFFCTPTTILKPPFCANTPFEPRGDRNQERLFKLAAAPLARVLHRHTLRHTGPAPD